MATITESLSEDYFIPDEVLIEILLRLPLLSLQLFKSVSKHWLSLITSSYFIRRLQKPRIDTPCGLFLRDAQFCDFVPLGHKATFFSLRGFYSIIQSCNGLLLCNNFVSCAYIYYVNNPFTDLRKDIPFPRYEQSTDIILAFDPTKSPYYKLVITQKKNDLHNRNWEQDWVEDRLQDWEENWGEDSDTKRILIYSSETGKWRICGPSFHKDMFRGFEDGIYWNKAIHWINYSDKLHSKFDIVDHPMITNMPTPASWITNILTSALHKKGRMEHTNLFESRGSLLFLMKNKSELYHVYEMREEASKWSLKYIVDDLNNIFPWYTCFLCIVLGEREGDSYMVIESDKKIVRYNFVSKTVSALFDCRDRDYNRRDYYYYFRGRFPYIASLAGV